MDTHLHTGPSPVQDRLNHVIVILVEPQSADNVGATLRAMRTMGMTRLRLVRPAPFDWGRLPVIAHRTEDLVAQLKVYDHLRDALADTTYVVGCTARRRSLNLPSLTPRAAANRAAQRATAGPVAFLFGREDTGLATEDLTCCHALLTIPTDPGYASLNLAQAVMVVLYEVRMAALDLTPRPPSLRGKGESASPPALGEGAGSKIPNPSSPFPGREGEESASPPLKREGVGSKIPNSPAPFPAREEGESASPPAVGEGVGEGAATGAQTEAMLAALEEAMHAVGYLIPSRAEATLRAWRAVLLRAEPTAQEAALITALARAIATRP